MQPKAPPFCDMIEKFVRNFFLRLSKHKLNKKLKSETSSFIYPNTNWIKNWNLKQMYDILEGFIRKIVEFFLVLYSLNQIDST
jgi:hypothetical protein